MKLKEIRSKLIHDIDKYVEDKGSLVEYYAVNAIKNIDDKDSVRVAPN